MSPNDLWSSIAFCGQCAQLLSSTGATGEQDPSAGGASASSAAGSGMSLGFLTDLPRVPCFRVSVLQGILGGFTLTGFRVFHEFRKARQQTSSNTFTQVPVLARVAGIGTVDFAVRSILVFSALSWLVCRYKYRQSREQIRRAIGQATWQPEPKLLPARESDPPEAAVSEVPKEEHTP